MNIRDRIILIRLMDKINNNPETAKILGIEVVFRNPKVSTERKEVKTDGLRVL